MITVLTVIALIVVPYFLYKKTILSEWLENVSFGELLTQIWMTYSLFAVCFIPAWVYILIRNVFEPQGFWQEFFIFGVGVYFLGGFQFVGLIIFLFLIVQVWKK